MVISQKHMLFEENICWVIISNNKLINNKFTRIFTKRLYYIRFHGIRGQIVHSYLTSIIYRRTLNLFFRFRVKQYI